MGFSYFDTNSGLSTAKETKLPRKNPPKPGLAQLQIAANSGPKSVDRLQRAANASPVVQRNIRMKGANDSRRTDGAARSLRREVTATIRRGDYDEISQDISKLQNSIRNREDDQRRHTPGTQSYDEHAHRITVERDQRKRLIQKIKTLENPHKTVGSAPDAEPKPSVPANIYELLPSE